MPLVLAGATSGATTIQATDGATQTITLPNSTGTLVTGTTPSGTIVGTTDTQTLTNKTLTSPTIATPTITGQATIPTINLTGGQITFPATQSASADANTLDDYEEGSWTPSVGGNATYNTVTGQYVKIGRLVVATFDMTINVLGTGSPNVISGLPFAGGGNTQGQPGSIGYFSSLAVAANYIALRIDIGGSVINTATTTGSQTTMSAGAVIFGNSSRLIGSVTYQVS